MRVPSHPYSWDMCYPRSLHTPPLLDAFAACPTWLDFCYSHLLVQSRSLLVQSRPLLVQSRPLLSPSWEGSVAYNHNQSTPPSRNALCLPPNLGTSVCMLSNLYTLGPMMRGTTRSPSKTGSRIYVIFRHSTSLFVGRSSATVSGPPVMGVSRLWAARRCLVKQNNSLALLRRWSFGRSSIKWIWYGERGSCFLDNSRSVMFWKKICDGRLVPGASFFEEPSEAS